MATNLPASQFVQPSAGLALYFPAGQALQMDAAADEVLPVGHVWHLLTSVAPSIVEYVPMLHELQAPAPCESLYLPATHTSQGPPLGPLCPELQVQASLEALPVEDVVEAAGQLKHVCKLSAPVVVEYLPAMQSEQALLPIMVLNFPAAHSTQSPFSS